MLKNEADSWVDWTLSRELPILRAAGEGQNLEYIQVFPKQAHDLAKEIAAFATSNAGTILLGVDDDGVCVGLAEASTAPQRDSLLRRIEGICRGPVKPAITPTVRFAVENECVVLAITVPKGNEPVYYAGNIPYLRHLTASRPAEPHEVVELIRGAVNFDLRRDSPETQASAVRLNFLAELMQELVRIAIFDAEFDDRMIDPWLSEMRAEFYDVANRLDFLGASKLAKEKQIDVGILDAAEAIHRVATMQLDLGSGAALRSAATIMFEKISALIGKISPELLGQVSISQIADQLAEIRQQVVSLLRTINRARQEGRIDDAQSQASGTGRAILVLANYGVNRVRRNLRSTMDEVGHHLHLSQTQRIYLDGGVSANRLLDRIENAARSFLATADSLVAN